MAIFLRRYAGWLYIAFQQEKGKEWALREIKTF